MIVRSLIIFKLSLYFSVFMCYDDLFASVHNGIFNDFLVVFHRSLNIFKKNWNCHAVLFWVVIESFLSHLCICTLWSIIQLNTCNFDHHGNAYKAFLFHVTHKTICNVAMIAKEQSFRYVELNNAKVWISKNASTVTFQNMWLSLQKLSLMVHLLLWEIPILSIETAVVLFCWPIAMLDLQYNQSNYLATVL